MTPMEQIARPNSGLPLKMQQAASTNASAVALMKAVPQKTPICPDLPLSSWRRPLNAVPSALLVPGTGSLIKL